MRFDRKSSDKSDNIKKANILAENRYLKAKGHELGKPQSHFDDPSIDWNKGDEDLEYDDYVSQNTNFYKDPNGEWETETQPHDFDPDSDNRTSLDWKHKADESVDEDFHDDDKWRVGQGFHKETDGEIKNLIYTGARIGDQPPHEPTKGKLVTKKPTDWDGVSDLHKDKYYWLIKGVYYPHYQYKEIDI